MTSASTPYAEWLRDLPPEAICNALMSMGAGEVLIKPLATNQDNTKNQIYVGADLSQLAKLSPGDPVARTGASGKRGRHHGSIFHAAVDWWWLGPGFRPAQAPHAKLIVHPQYPEVRLSGVVQGCAAAPRWLLDREMVAGTPGRLLLVAPIGTRIYAMVIPPDGVANSHFRRMFEGGERFGPFGISRLKGQIPLVATKQRLLSRVQEIARMGWLDPVKLAGGQRIPYVGQNAVGYTLEAYFGIDPNGVAEPDFEGWELKGHTGNRLNRRPLTGMLTLLTPEPDGGMYRHEGVIPFVQRWGYGDSFRKDFAGGHRVGEAPNPRTQLQLVLSGFRSPDDFDSDGDLRLVDEAGCVAASWTFAKILGHWSRKHARCAYVPAVRAPGGPAMAFADYCWLGQGATFKNFLAALSQGYVKYDPGIHIDRRPNGGWSSRRRSQFRAAGRDLAQLYDSFACEPA